MNEWSGSAARGMARRRILTADGRMTATMLQTLTLSSNELKHQTNQSENKNLRT
jgi:hypothetical protein